MAERIFERGTVPGLVHDCGDELRRFQQTSDGTGTLVQCSCGSYFTLRETTFRQFLLGIGRDNHRGRWHALAHWRYLGRVPS
jgi:hypothetical protein